MTTVVDTCPGCGRAVQVNPFVYIEYEPFCARCREIMHFRRKAEGLKEDYEQRLTQLQMEHIERMKKIEAALEMEEQL